MSAQPFFAQDAKQPEPVKNPLYFKMINLHKTETDDGNFLSIVLVLIDYFYQKYAPKNIHAIHIDNWFGDKWLGFRGKILGAAGVRDKDFDSKLVCQFDKH